MSLPLPGFSPLLLTPQPGPSGDSSPPQQQQQPSPHAVAEDRSSFLAFMRHPGSRAHLDRWEGIRIQLLTSNGRLPGGIAASDLKLALDRFERRLLEIDDFGGNRHFGDHIWLVLDQGLPLLEQFGRQLADERVSNGRRSGALAGLVERLNTCGPGLVSELQDRVRDLGSADGGLVSAARRVMERLIRECIRHFIFEKLPNRNRGLDSHEVTSYQQALYPRFGLTPPTDPLAWDIDLSKVQECESTVRTTITPPLLSGTLADEALAAFGERLSAALGFPVDMLSAGLPWGTAETTTLEDVVSELASTYGRLPLAALLDTAYDDKGAIARLRPEPSLLARHFDQELRNQHQMFSDAPTCHELARWSDTAPIPGHPPVQWTLEGFTDNSSAWKSSRDGVEPLMRRDLAHLATPRPSKIKRIAKQNSSADSGVLSPSWLTNPRRVPFWCRVLPEERLQDALVEYGATLPPNMHKHWQETLVWQGKHVLLTADALRPWVPHACRISPRLLALAFENEDATTRNTVLMTFLDLALTGTDVNKVAVLGRLRRIACGSSTAGLWVARERGDAAAATDYVTLIGQAADMGWLEAEERFALLRPAPPVRPSCWDLMMSGKDPTPFLSAYLEALGQLLRQGTLSAAELSGLLASASSGERSAMESAFAAENGSNVVLAEKIAEWERAGLIKDGLLLAVTDRASSS